MNIFGGMKILLIYFWGHPISMYFRVFLKVNIQNRDIFGGCKNSNIFWGSLKFLIYFGVNGSC